MPAEKSMDEMWGQTTAKDGAARGKGALFRDGNYAMFIHWGLYSHLGGRWKDRTYYGIGEWIMHPAMAGIPVSEYMGIARDFNPVKFDGRSIAQLAKDAGMKYIVITSKHHEGFALFKSDADAFNIADATPFGRDPLAELAEACRDLGLGLGFYYSQYQDWTAPGGGGGPETDADGNAVNFDDYFRRKCLPQVEEITTRYGPIELIWFDTPGEIGLEYVEQLLDTVRRNQPDALVNSRIGHGLGDYVSLGDMEVPVKNVDGLWETVDTTNDSWSYAWYDQNWKSPGEILERLIATIARGGTYMLNVGPLGDGTIPERAAESLRAAGKWIARYPEVVYGTDGSPWGRAMPWGDVVTKHNTLYLCVFDWPEDGILRLPGLKTPIASAALLRDGKAEALSVAGGSGWTCITVPAARPEPLVSVVAVTLEGAPEADAIHGVDPLATTSISAVFGAATGCDASCRRWMEKYGEWKTMEQVTNWGDDATVTWEVDVLEPGEYRVDLTYAGRERMEWRVETDRGDAVQNNQNASHIYTRFPIGWITLGKPGKHTLTVRLLSGDRGSASLSCIHLIPV
jgi:alpha-L-fucosidase